MEMAAQNRRFSFHREANLVDHPYGRLFHPELQNIVGGDRVLAGDGSKHGRSKMIFLIAAFVMHSPWAFSEGALVPLDV
jgi:hypothetical protein